MIHCPKCGAKLDKYQELPKGYKWCYREYPCPNCQTIWDWKCKKGGALIYLHECPLYYAPNVATEVLGE